MSLFTAAVFHTFYLMFQCTGRNSLHPAIIGAKACKGPTDGTYATMTTKVTVHVYDMVSRLTPEDKNIGPT